MTRDLLFISHCTPYPPDKGEKIRAWNIIRHLARDWRVHLGCLAGSESDMAQAAPLREVCASLGMVRIHPRAQRLRAMLRARPGRPLMPDCYTAAPLRRWVDETAARHHPALTYLYTVAIAEHASGLGGRRILDAVDIDSAKWSEYATQSAFPQSAVWAREGRTLLAYERRIAAACEKTLFVSEPEADRFMHMAPELASRVDWVENGVDFSRFAPGLGLPSPFGVPGPHIVFTGHMDYRPNIDAALWFATEILPLIQRQVPAHFWVVGANPVPQILALRASTAVHVTGRVADTRPYVAAADVCVCPLRLARGIQNKVLESMAMARPVVATGAAFDGIRAQAGQDLLTADSAADFAASVLEILNGRHPGLGDRARQVMEARYAWPQVLQKLDMLLEA